MGHLCCFPPGVFVSGLRREHDRADWYRSTLAGVLRLIFVSVNYSLGQFRFSAPPLSSPLRLNEAISPIFWTNFECFCGVVAANLLPLWPLLRKTPRAGSYCLQAYKKFSTSHVEHMGSTQELSRQKSAEVSTPPCSNSDDPVNVFNR